MKRKIRFLLYAPMAFFILCRLLFLHIRFGTKICKIRTNRIGHLFGNLDMHLCLASSEKVASQRLIFVGDESVCNQVALDMVKQRVEKYHDGYAHFVAYEILRRLRINRFIYLLPSDQDTTGVLFASPRNFEVPDYVERETTQYLKNLDENAFFTTMVRDSAYMLSKFGNGYDYHDYRNSAPEVHFSATNKFAKRHNLLGIRMGSVVDYKLSSDLVNMVDYANFGRTPTLDIGLINECLFFSHCGAGFSSVPRALRKPMVNVNQVALNYSGNNLLLFIPKKLWLIRDRRFLSYLEIITSEIGYIVDGRRYAELGIELVENTEEEIFDAHEEAYLRLINKFDNDFEMEKLNADIIRKYPKDAITPIHKAPIGQKFLRENLSLFVT